MRIHTNLTAEDFGQLVAAPKLKADVYMERWYEYGSRSRARAFDVILRGLHSTTRDGTKRRRPNLGASHDRSYYDQWAATYDEWGWFLAALFEADPLARCEGTYDGREDFHEKTNNKYRPCPGRKIADDLALDRLAAMLNESDQWNGGDVCEALALTLQETGRYIAP